MPLNGIKAVLFDMDGTLLEHRPNSSDIFTRFAQSLGMYISEHSRLLAARWEHYYFASSPEINQDMKVFDGDSAGFWQNFGQRRLVALGCSDGQAVELAPIFSAHMAEHYKPAGAAANGSIPVLEKLRDEGYTLGVVSNRDKPYHERLTELGLDGFFAFSLAAGEVNSWKPDPGIFYNALQRAGAQPQETVYVGDNYFADVIGARKAGLIPILYDPRGIFDDPGCTVITSFEQLPSLLKR